MSGKNLLKRSAIVYSACYSYPAVFFFKKYFSISLQKIQGGFCVFGIFLYVLGIRNKMGVAENIA